MNLNSDYSWPAGTPRNPKHPNGYEHFRVDVEGNGGTFVPSFSPEILLAGLL
jgi:hypothetical protein